MPPVGPTKVPPGGGQWKHSDGRARRTDQPTEVKRRWARVWQRTRPSVITVPVVTDDAPTLFDEVTA